MILCRLCIFSSGAIDLWFNVGCTAWMLWPVRVACIDEIHSHSICGLSSSQTYSMSISLSTTDFILMIWQTKPNPRSIYNADSFLQTPHPHVCLCREREVSCSSSWFIVFYFPVKGVFGGKVPHPSKGSRESVSNAQHIVKP